ncbi:hypothetical protein ARALYDRAFT_915732 [Arabidopsis lyrata subsp. lyrata]|uniref:Uncharacterized protein n=1 Tax=Arabidopsis lyrata subsp. lyrata TaxID=81972 RepID=D7MHY3_ARALL|nr:hypothetical protein ARALYDRAFT_915732 [Arabidopsis lyrata subsp. lyrata]
MAIEVATPAPTPIPSESIIVLAPTTTTTASVEIGNQNSSPDLRFFFRSDESSFLNFD